MFAHSERSVSPYQQPNAPRSAAENELTEIVEKVAHNSAELNKLQGRKEYNTFRPQDPNKQRSITIDIDFPENP